MTASGEEPGCGQWCLAVKKKQRDHIANRLASISSTTANVENVRIPELKGGKKPSRAKREPVFRPGKLFLSKSNHLRCVIRNVSETGAYVHMEGIHPLPAIVVLRFDQTGVTKKCRVVWQKEIEAGLEFIKPAAEGDT